MAGLLLIPGGLGHLLTGAAGEPLAQPLADQVRTLDEGPGHGDDDEHQARGQRDLRQAPAAGAGKLAVVDGDFHVALAHVEGVLGKGRQQCLVGEDVDAPRQPPRGLRHASVSAAAKDVRAPVAHCAHAEVHVLAHLLGREGLQIEAVGDALLQLADFRLVEIVVELRLTEKDDLQQLVAIGLQVAEQADLFQGGDGHALGFLDEDHHLAIIGVLLEQAFLQRVHDMQAVGVCIQAQFHLHGDGVQGVLRRQTGIGQVDDVHLVSQALFQHAAEHGLAAAHLAHHLDDALAAGDGVHQGLQNLAPGTARIEQLGVRRYPERRAPESEVFVIHRCRRHSCRRSCLRP